MCRYFHDILCVVLHITSNSHLIGSFEHQTNNITIAAHLKINRTMVVLFRAFLNSQQKQIVDLALFYVYLLQIYDSSHFHNHEFMLHEWKKMMMWFATYHPTKFSDRGISMNDPT